MSRHEATFEVLDRTDAHAVQRLLERAYDAMREELDRVDDDHLGTALAEFEAIHEASKRPSTGRLTIIYEQDDTPLSG